MQTIEMFTVPDVPECTVELPQGLRLMDARVVDDEIVVYYMDQRASDEGVTLTWYVFGLGMEVPDAFPASLYKSVEMSDGSIRFLFFKQDAKKREPIVAKVPGDKPYPGPGAHEPGAK